MLRIRFDPFCMTPPLETDSVAHAAERIKEYAEIDAVEYDRGDCLLLDNWRVLHGRGEGAAAAPSRRLQRWISRG